MIAVVARPGVAYQLEHAEAMAEGLARHGLQAERLAPGALTAAPVVICWGWRIGAEYRARGHDVLVMERGHVGDRRAWTSCGWNGLAGRGRYVQADDDGARWRRHWGGLMQPWRRDGAYTLVLGQVAGDAALHGLDVRSWAQGVADALAGPVRYRPHPRARADFCPAGAELAPGTLDAALAGASVVVTWNSTAGVHCVLSGVPTVALDAGAMCWPVAGHALGEIVRPDRRDWCWQMAWTQFQIDEIRSGFAWECLAMNDALAHRQQFARYCAQENP